ncbi:MAG TPA: hypothetical protein VJ376_00110 [Pseudomonadota bacterium]|nr:hypothetical protein [Pseudomonadota bacterium]
MSLGIGGDDKWDMSIADRGIRVFQFDDTIDAAPTQHARCNFFRCKVVPAVPRGKSERTIEAILAEHALSGAGDLLLKVDIDGGEWEIFNVLDESIIAQFRQIVCEFHDFCRMSQPGWRLRALQIFEKLSRTHCVLHVHGNNRSPLVVVGNVSIPDVIELTFVRRKDYNIRESDTVFPTELDRPNYPGDQDLYLGAFRFE